MGGLYPYAIAGGGFILIGVMQSIVSLTTTTKPSSLNQIKTSTSLRPSENPSSSYSSMFITIFLFSFLFIVNSFVSIFDAFRSSDRVGTSVQLQVLAIASLFSFYSGLGFLINFKKSSLSLPDSILNTIALLGFVEEFMFFYAQKKDPSGVENQYFDLLLVPITICVFSTVLELRSSSKSNYSKFARGVGLILQGTWFVQMGFSFYSNLMVHGCSLHEKSRGNYTVKCKGHPELHRGRAIATLQFNFHLALMVVVAVILYSVMGSKDETSNQSDFLMYRPLGAEMQRIQMENAENAENFTLDSDEEDGIREEEKKVEKKEIEIGMNGFSSYE